MSHVRTKRPIALSTSPSPNWDLWGDSVPPRYTLQTMRGCPWACSFCAASRLLGPARVKPDAQIERIHAIEAAYYRVEDGEAPVTELVAAMRGFRDAVG